MFNTLIAGVSTFISCTSNVLASLDNRIKITVNRIIYLEICFHDVNNKYKCIQIYNTFFKPIVIVNFVTLSYYSINVMHNLSCYKV